MLELVFRPPVAPDDKIPIQATESSYAHSRSSGEVMNFNGSSCNLGLRYPQKGVRQERMTIFSSKMVIGGLLEGVSLTRKV